MECKVSEYLDEVRRLWEDTAVFKTDSILRPDYFACFGPRESDYSAVDLERIELLMDLDICDMDSDEEIIIVDSISEV